ncbi:endonuclease [Bacillus sp. MUM 116]|uniref:HNH endonuclease signature motif containing protein n=1 Tax=Bacillus sp. MUM 116 TaxID=1678002 RepID=UPI0008F5E19E|nr:HNH endonuclease signature motif containing protein [Bacillus sp. MUM 116]OIK13582.1 endonuclease [Bacillus sp. MUM 116]
MAKHRYYDKYKRNKEARAFYKSAAWLNCRKIVLIRDTYLCQECLRKGKITAANTVHHIKHLEEYPDLALDIDNLETICRPCHNNEHPEKAYTKKEKQQRKINAIKVKANKEIY